MWKNYKFQVPEAKKFRYIIVADAKNEADDQFTIAHCLMSPKLDVRGIIASHFDHKPDNPCKGHTAQAGYEEILLLLDLMHLSGKYPVLCGSEHPLPPSVSLPTDISSPEFREAISTEAASFIVEEAMKEDSRPLYVGVQSAITDVAAAILMEPRICDRMTCVWVGGGSYPYGGEEFNLAGDITAANLVMNSSMPLWQIPRNAYKQFVVTLAELQLKVEPYGKIGNYLFRQMVEFNNAHSDAAPWPHGELWSLGDEGCIAPLLEERGRTDHYDEIPAPQIDPGTMKYLHGTENRKIRVYKNMNVRADLEDLFAKLQINFPERDS